MPLVIIGEHPLACDEQGLPKSRIATIFLRSDLLYTIPGIHAQQRLGYVEWLNRQRQAEGKAALSEAEEAAEWDQSVDLIVEGDLILIRPDPQNMALAFAADELLQEIASKQKIRFLHVMDERVRQAIKEHGECWRISPLPKSPEQLKQMLHDARMRIGGRAVYYYNMITGTRYLTCGEFARLDVLEPRAMARQLIEIKELSGKRNRMGHPEVDFFACDRCFGHSDFEAYEFSHLSPLELREAYEQLRRKFEGAVRPELRQDNLEDAEWRKAMFSALLTQKHEVLPEEILRGLSPEFFMQIEWLPGGRIEGGELIFDPIFDELEKRPADEELAYLCDERVRGFIVNFIREFGDVEYVNVGRVAGSLSHRSATIKARGLRGVYIAEIKLLGQPHSVVRVIRMQKWDVLGHLGRGKDLLNAIVESEQYTEYVLDRRLGCRQLGMNLPNQITTHKLYEKYDGPRKEYRGMTVWSTYFERDYIGGVATDKIQSAKYANPEFALAFARMLGRAATSSLIVGKMGMDGDVLFDDGDEVLLEDGHGMPREIVVADHTGSFVGYEETLEEYARDYASPVNRRVPHVPDPAAFANAYLDALLERLAQIQQDYRKRRRAFDTLFKHHRDEPGSFAYRWRKVLERLDKTDPQHLGQTIRKHFACPQREQPCQQVGGLSVSSCGECLGGQC